ncbi:MAG: O-antigen ligase family protein [Bacteroidetes bacterium]|nr:O-antigen ligase family protein [Bacteroidota bacterium]
MNTILSILVMVGFFAMMFFTTSDKNRLYIKYIIFASPLLGLLIIPGDLGITNFNLLSVVFILFFYRRKYVQLKGGVVYIILLLVFLIAALLGAYFAESLNIDAPKVAIDFISIFIFVKILVEECLADDSFFYEVIKCLKTVLICSIIFLGFQFVFGPSFSLASSLNPNITEDALIRYPSFFIDPQTFSQFLAGTSFLCLIKEQGEDKVSTKNYLLLVATLVAIFFTGGRGGFGGWVLGFSLVVLFGNAKYRMYAIVIGIILFIIIYNFQDSFPMFTRGDDISDSYDFRFSIWQDAFNIFLNHPLVGIGPGDYANYVSVHNPEQHWMLNNEILYFNHPESGYLKLLVEYGAIGFSALMAFILVPIAKGFFSFVKYKDSSFILLIAGIVSWMAGFYTVYSLDDIRLKIMFITIICLLVTNYNRFLPNYEDEQDI